MNQKEIQELIKYISKSNVTEVEIEMKDFKITIKSENKKSEITPDEKLLYMQQKPVQPAVEPVAQNVIPTEVETVTTTNKPETKTTTVEEDKYVIIKSPMIGTFYRSSSPDKPSFVEVGDKFKKGDTVCIIEAMKLFNEIEAEIEGRIIKVLVDDASPVEYDQPLFLVDPA